MGAKALKILIICQYYPPEHAPIGVMIQELGQDLARLGHEVTVITGFPNHPEGRVYPGYRQHLFKVERHGDVNVVRCFMWLSPKKSISVRIWAYLTFGLSALSAAAKLPKQDVLLITSPPLTNGLIAMALSRSGALPFVFNVQDLYPDAAVNLGLIRNRHLIGALLALEKRIYRKASRISVISEGFRRTLVGKGVQPAKIGLIYNWLDAVEIAPEPKDNNFTRSHNLTGKFVVLYSGTIGLISGAEMIVECAEMLAGDRDILFLFVGEGVTRDAVRELAESRRLSNMMFLPFQPRAVLPQVQSAADVSLVTLKAGMGRTSVPSKVLGYMAAAKPVVAGVDQDSDTGALLERAGCGICVPPGDPKALAGAIKALYRDRRLGQRMGRKGLQFLRRHCERRAATARYARLLESAAGDRW